MCIFYLYFVILIFLNNLQTIFNQTNVHIINIMNTKYSAILLSGLILSADICPCFAAIQSLQKEPIATEIIQTQWKGKKVAFLGDSITDKSHVGTTKNYWQYLEDMLGLEALVYGLNGHNWIGVLEQAQKLKEDFEQANEKLRKASEQSSKIKFELSTAQSELYIMQGDKVKIEAEKKSRESEIESTQKLLAELMQGLTRE